MMILIRVLRFVDVEFLRTTATIVVSLFALAFGDKILANASNPAFTDPGFESIATAPGAFSSLGDPWDLRGTNTFVVQPFIPHTSSPTSCCMVRSAVFDSIDGEQYLSTYAGGALFAEDIAFALPGTYEVSVYAASPSGSVFLSHFQPVNAVFVPADFTFELNRQPIGPLHHLEPGTNWTRFSTTFTIGEPGVYQLGINNETFASYIINYDRLSITAVPEPMGLTILAIGMFFGVIFPLRRIRRN
jgi:hypothetical protein